MAQRKRNPGAIRDLESIVDPVSGNITTTGSITAASMTATGNVLVGGNLTVCGDASIEGNLTVSGGITMAGQQIRHPVRVPTVSTVSGTSVPLATGIESWAGEVTVRLNNVSTNGTSNIILQLGTATGYTTSGYSGGLSYTLDAAAVQGQANINGFRITQGWAAAAGLKGLVRMEPQDAGNTTWIVSVGTARDNGSSWQGAGAVTLPGTLTSIRISTVTGGDIFDGGVAGVAYRP